MHIHEPKFSLFTRSKVTDQLNYTQQLLVGIKKVMFSVTNLSRLLTFVLLPVNLTILYGLSFSAAFPTYQ